MMRKYCPYLGIAAGILTFILIETGFIGIVIAIVVGVAVSEACKRSQQ